MQFGIKLNLENELTILFLICKLRKLRHVNAQILAIDIAILM